MGPHLASAAKAVLSRYGRATAARRPPPELLIVGSKRGGTTSLWQYLAEHPGMLTQFPTPNSKGTYFFPRSGTGASAGGCRTLHLLERCRAEGRLGYAPATGESSPYDLYHPLAPVRAAQVAPGALVVAVLRNPIDRAYSHWKERRRHSEALGFPAAIEAEADRTKGEAARILADPTVTSFAHRHQSYVDQGRYAPMLQRWFGAYGREQVMVVTAEVFYDDPQAFIDRVTDRLGLPRHRVLDTSPRNDAPSDPMDDDLRSRLRVDLAGDIAAVEDLLGISTGWS